jgi:hypothetical protein
MLTSPSVEIVHSWKVDAAHVNPNRHVCNNSHELHYAVEVCSPYTIKLLGAELGRASQQSCLALPDVARVLHISGVKPQELQRAFSTHLTND